MPRDIGGVIVETVGDLLGEEGAPPPTAPLTPPRLDGAPEFQAGVFFGMPERVYHSIHACSASGLKDLSVSNMDYWTNSVLNPEREDDDTEAKMLGRAYHVRICEGAEAFEERYAVGLDPKDYPAFHPDDNPGGCCFTVDHIRGSIRLSGGSPSGTKKDALIAQLMDINPAAIVWDLQVREHEERNSGKVMLSHKQWSRIQLAARMIENDPHIKTAFTGGYPEVAIFWHCPETGVPMKAKIDYLKLGWIVDLKSFANKMKRPIQRAIDMDISSYKYFVPVVVYLEAVAAAKRMIKDSGGHAARIWGEDVPEADEKKFRQWSWLFAHQPEPQVLYVFQQKGAPVTRGRLMDKGGAYTATEYAVQSLKRKWKMCAETFGTDPWLDIAPIVRTEDENLTFTATDFGNQE